MDSLYNKTSKIKLTFKQYSNNNMKKDSVIYKKNQNNNTRQEKNLS